MYYIAYGSNLNTEQMRRRCPGASVLGTAELKGWRLLFKGSQTGSYLTIEKAAGYTVPVAVWEVTDDDIEALDRYEGYPSFYYKKRFVLPCSDGKRHHVFAYIMHEERVMGVPANYYVNTCLEGYEKFGFDWHILEDALKYSTKRKGRVA